MVLKHLKFELVEPGKEKKAYVPFKGSRPFSFSETINDSSPYISGKDFSQSDLLSFDDEGSSVVVDDDPACRSSAATAAGTTAARPQSSADPGASPAAEGAHVTPGNGTTSSFRTPHLTQALCLCHSNVINMSAATNPGGLQESARADKYAAFATEECRDSYSRGNLQKYSIRQGGN